MSKLEIRIVLINRNFHSKLIGSLKSTRWVLPKYLFLIRCCPFYGAFEVSIELVFPKKNATFWKQTEDKNTVRLERRPSTNLKVRGSNLSVFLILTKRRMSIIRSSKEAPICLWCKCVKDGFLAVLLVAKQA